LALNETHALYPLPEIERAQGGKPLFFATFNYVDFQNTDLAEIDDDPRFIADAGHDKFHYPLNYIFAPSAADGSLSVHVHYDNVYFNNLTIDDMNARLGAILERYCASPAEAAQRRNKRFPEVDTETQC